MTDLPENESPQLREVWGDNLEHELNLICDIVDEYSYIAMDTEYPGTIFCTTPNPRTHIKYDDLRANVNRTKLIQLGLTFSNENGKLPSDTGAGKYPFWQFNFREFNVREDAQMLESIKVLRDSGIDFVRNNEEGIDALRFGELLTSSGVVMNDNVHIVTFHGAYDLGYLIKLLSGLDLPETQADFMKKIEMYFPIAYDVKNLMEVHNLHGGLNKLASHLNVERVGVSHQAGSDSLVTCRTFMKLKDIYFNGSVPDNHIGVLYGLRD